MENYQLFKKIRRSRSYLLAIIFVGFTGLTLYIIFQSYEELKEQSRQANLARLKAITATLSVQIDASKHQTLIEINGKKDLKGEYLASYREIKSLFKQVQLKNGLNTEIYTLVRIPGLGDNLKLIVNSGDSIYFMNNYKAPQILLNNYEQGAAIGPYEDFHGEWLSAFSPFRDSSGQVAGIVMADIRFDSFKKEITSTIVKRIIITVIELMIFVFIILVITQLVSRNINQLHRNIRKLSQKLAMRNEQLERVRADVEDKNIELEELNSNLEAIVKKRTAQLEQSNKEMQTFLYHASHRMKSPVVNMLGIVNLSKIEFDRKNWEEYFEKIEVLNKQMGRLLDQLNIAASIQEEPQLQVFDAMEQLQPIINELQASYKIQVKATYHLNVPLRTDPVLFSLMFRSILENACYFTSKARSSGQKVRLELRVDKKQLHLIVEDNGPGIPTDLQESIFDMFLIANKESQGNGLGLYITKKAVDRLNGNIRVDSSGNEGTMVIVEIPNRLE